MKLAKALGTALSAGLGAAGEVAQAQDKSEQELSRVLVANRIKEFQKIKEDAAETVKNIRKRENEIDVFNGQVVGRDGATDQERLLSRNEIGQLIDSYGKDFLVDYITSGESSLRVFGDAKKIEGKPFDASALLTDKQDLEAAVPEGKGIASGQSKRVVERVERQLAELGYSTDIKVPVEPVYTGGFFKFEQTPDLDVASKTVTEVDAEGKPVRNYTRVETTDKKTGKVTITYQDPITNKPVEPAQGSQLYDNAAMAKLHEKPEVQTSKVGYLAYIDEDQSTRLIPAPDGKGYQTGALMKDGTIRGYVGAELAMTPYIPPEQVKGGIVVLRQSDFPDQNSWNSLIQGRKVVESIPGIPQFTEAEQETTRQHQNLSALRDTIDFRLDIHEQYGDDLYNVSGTFASLVTGVGDLVEGAAKVVDRVIAAETPQEKMRITRQNENVLRQAIANKESILSRVRGTEKEIATARVLDLAAADMMAFDKGKSKGEDRLTDNDFKIFQATVTGDNAEQTIGLIESTYNEALSQYTSQYKTMNKYLTAATNHVERTDLDLMPQLSVYQELADVLPSPDSLRSDMQKKIKQTRGEVAQTAEALGKDTGPALTFNSAMSSNVKLKIRGNTVSFEVDGTPSNTTLSLEDARDLGHLSETDYQKAKASQQKAQ